MDTNFFPAAASAIAEMSCDATNHGALCSYSDRDDLDHATLTIEFV